MDVSPKRPGICKESCTKKLNNMEMAGQTIPGRPIEEGLTDLIKIVNPTNPTNPINSANTTNPVDPTNPVNLDDQPLRTRTDSPTSPRIKGPLNTEQPSQCTAGTIPQYYVGDIGPRIGKPTIYEPHVDLGEDIELARLREAVGQEAILCVHQAELNCCNREASDVLGQFIERTTGRGQDSIRNPLQGRLINRLGMVYQQRIGAISSWPQEGLTLGKNSLENSIPSSLHQNKYLDNWRILSKYKIRQGEPLKDYSQRFMAEATEVKGLFEKGCHTSLLRGILSLSEF
uniref:Retrotransposon gag domain-containing protein n=1 Tax=Cannabis sativa TaxID=3483 RepID=A0A803PQY5_CANSA